MEQPAERARRTDYMRVRRDPHFGLFQLEVPETGERVMVRRVAGLHLVERGDFITYVQDQGTTDRLVAAEELTSYHANGQKKERRADGKLPNTKTYYDLVEWREIDFNRHN